MTRALLPITILLAGCAPAVAECPSPPAAPATPEPPEPEALAELPGGFSFEASETTPAPVREQFGRLVGVWSCQGERRQPDGSFTKTQGRSRWTFLYALAGQAIADVFEPPTGQNPGINLRLYLPEDDRWTLAWTTPRLARYDHFEARAEGEELVMRGEIAAAGPFPDHRAKITFFEIAADSFEWRYEAAKPGSADGPWQLQSKIHCRRAEDSPGSAG